jgi:hypothetical protein
MTPQQMLQRYAQALDARRPLEALWQGCYDMALPRPGSGIQVFDATAADAAEQLAASLLAELTPPWSRWFGLAPARGAAEDPATLRALEDATATLQRHFDQSNFGVEVHQAFLELVVAGTGILLVEEAPLGEASAFRFAAVPLRHAVLAEGPSGRLDTVFRQARLTAAQLRQRHPAAELPMEIERAAEANGPRLPGYDALAMPQDPMAVHRVVEAVWPDHQGIRYMAVLADEPDRPVDLAEGRFSENPFIAFRWLKAPGEVYGRGPVMKALPDIRTANKVVELVLKNASIACTGIWQAEDDGVLNPATIKLVPGAIIPKAPGSAGLTPLAAPGNFNVSELVLQDLRTRIRGALLADRLAPLETARMTATEVLERSAQTARLLGATYGRLQSELLMPLVTRCLAILRRRGEIPAALLEGHASELRYESPLARVQGRADAANTLMFLQAVNSLGGAAAAQLDAAAATRWLARSLGAPAEVLVPRQPAADPQPGVTP